jgi:hypothetical protein
LNKDALRLTVTYTDFVPDTVELKIYNESKTQLGETITDLVNSETGVYYYDYQIPTSTTKQQYYYEFTATYSGKTIVNRDYFVGNWVE